MNVEDIHHRLLYMNLKPLMRRVDGLDQILVLNIPPQLGLKPNRLIRVGIGKNDNNCDLNFSSIKSIIEGQYEIVNT